MDYQEKYEFMKTCLKKWNYPQIHAVDDTEIIEIFSSINRPSLVSWLLKRLYPELLTENENYDEQTLMNHMYTLGFCTNSQKNNIFSSEFHEDQMEVLFKTFVVSDKILSVQLKTDFSKVSLDDLDDLLNLEMNLFPCYGPVSVLTAEANREVEEFIKSIDSQPPLPDEVVSDSPTVLGAHESLLEQLADDLNYLLPQFVPFSLEFQQRTDSFQNDNASSLKDIDDSIRWCAESMKKISDYFSNSETICEFAANAVKMKNFQGNLQNKDSFKLLKNLVDATQEVVNGIPNHLQK